MSDEAKQVQPGGDTTPPNDDMTQVISEYRQMFRYVNSLGLAFDEKTQTALNAVGADPEKASFADLMTAHGALAKIVAPATPLSLEATEPAPGPMGTLRRPALVLWMIVVAVLAGIGFTWSEIYIQKGPSTAACSAQCQLLPAGGAIPPAANSTTSTTGSTTTTTVTGQITKSTDQTPTKPPEQKPVTPAMIINWCFAASLGAVFYVLFTVHEYVKDRTFDPRYNTVYLIRFVLGVLSGLIMASLIGPSLFASSTSAQIKGLGPAVLALLGGFSTEAVYQILQRMVDILVAAVKGDGADAAKTKAAQAGQKELLNLADDPSMPPDMKSKAIAAAKKIAS
jgi:disulfide bond formation protein DsbB